VAVMRGPSLLGRARPLRPVACALEEELSGCQKGLIPPSGCIKAMRPFVEAASAKGWSNDADMTDPIKRGTEEPLRPLLTVPTLEHRKRPTMPANIPVYHAVFEASSFSFSGPEKKNSREPLNTRYCCLLRQYDHGGSAVDVRN
jgi:hypothetical protein